MAHPARRYDYWLGGKDNFEADRLSGDAIKQIFPDIVTAVRENRLFSQRAVKYAVERLVVRQFLDIGTGLPTANNTHEVAQATDASSRIVYVDNDPIVLTHGRALLVTNADTTVVTADLREPEGVIGHDEVRELVDFTQPVGVLLIAMTHFLRDEEREPVMSVLRESLVPGSFLAATHVTVDNHSSDAVEGVEAVYRKTPTPIFFRRHDEIARFFDGFALVAPGLVTVDEWRPDPDDPAPAPTRWLYGGVERRS